ncbi:MAG: hypothetical protein JXA10_08070 [Anaerolineae bacterium]|nr:hypothetical protein [Anaerolineae bacterium]
MDKKIPQKLQDMIGQLDHAVPPIAPTGASAPYNTTNGLSGSPDVNRETAAMINAARRLAHGPKPALPEAALDRIEAQLRAHHAEVHHSTTHSAARPQPNAQYDFQHVATARARRIAQASWRGTKRTLRYAAALLLVITLLTSGLTYASASSVPNEPLYTVKLGVEEIRLVLASTEQEPGLRVNFAERRLDEFETLLKRHIVYPQVLEEASAQMDRALTLLQAGYGDRQKLDAEIANLTYQQGKLIEDAAKIATPETYNRLHVVSTWNNAVYVRVVAESTADSTNNNTTMIANLSAPSIIPEVQPPTTTISSPTGTEPSGNGANATLGPATVDPDTGTATPNNDDPQADKDNDNNGNKDKDKDQDNNGQGNTANPGQSNTSNNSQGQGNTANPGQSNTDNPGQGNTDNPSQGNTDNPGQGNTGNNGQGQGNTDNPGQGQDKDKDKDK